MIISNLTKKAELFTGKTHFDKNHTAEGQLDPPAL